MPTSSRFRTRSSDESAGSAPIPSARSRSSSSRPAVMTGELSTARNLGRLPVGPRGQHPGMASRLRSATAGAVAAAAWAAQEPLDQRVLRCDYSDVAVLGKAVTRGPRWRATGLAIHIVNGAAFGLVFHEAAREAAGRPAEARVRDGDRGASHALSALLFVDRYHPARSEPGVPPLLTNRRAFAQATWRHALFGAVLGRLA